MKRIFTVFCLCFTLSTAYAQKLPDVQRNSVPAPQVKVDGKATEWNDTYAAENKRTELFYTMANDNKNLYLLIKSASREVINKILVGGITLTVNTEGKKKDQDAATITFPLNTSSRAPRGGGGRGSVNIAMSAPGPERTDTQRDSLQNARRRTQLSAIKEIRVTGIKSITDTLISIYNEYGIKAVANIDPQGAFVYELALPLTLLSLSADKPKEFAYQIKVNGLSNRNFGNFGGGGGGGGIVTFGGSGGFDDMISATDFWGKYLLLKK